MDMTNCAAACELPRRYEFNPSIPGPPRETELCVVVIDLGGPRAARVGLVQFPCGRRAFRTVGRPPRFRPDHN